MKAIRNIIYILTAAVATLLPTSCIISEFEEEPVFGKGESEIAFDVSFRPLVDALPSTKTTGSAIRHIESLWVIVYNQKGDFYTKQLVYDVDDTSENKFSYSNSDPEVTTSIPGAPADGFAESTYCHSTFKMSLPLGKYYIYTVANYDLTNFTGKADELKSIKLTWNADDISANNQMFGFFTDSDAENSMPEAAPLISINKDKKSLHAWVRRAASKVTVSFNGEQLNENVSIYIHTVQIKDIPSSCYLGKDNVPVAVEETIADGEVIYHRPVGVALETAGLKITKGLPDGGLDMSEAEGGVHHEDADALFLFENRQPDTDDVKGKWQDADEDKVIDYPEGGSPDNVDFKDGVPYGSYIEVKGYYVNKIAGKASQGPIVYRFMLGKDTEKNCDVERSNHFKVELCFKGDANNVAWHIDYEPETPEISVPSPLYISYGYNESINIPVAVRGASVSESTTIKATIIENNWGFPEHKYISSYPEPQHGYLSFENLKGTVSISDRSAWLKEGAQYLSAVAPEHVDVNECHYNVPVYTRPLILGNSLTGHNPYVSYERNATVRFEVVLEGQTYAKDIQIIQVKRVVNPAGVWRSDNNTSPFNICLMELNEPDTGPDGLIETDFYAPASDGPWTAHIEEGADWVEIAHTGTNNWGTADLKGSTGSEIRFDYRPRNINSTGAVRCGVIKITYHNDNCAHYVFVSQGNGTVNLAGTNWYNRNVLFKDTFVENPLLEGSMFKFGNPDDAILVDNNHRDGYGYEEDCWGKTFYINDKSTLKTFESLGHDLDGFDDTRVIFTDTDVMPSTYAQWHDLETLHRRYGVMYGDECTKTQTNTSDAYSYWKVGQEKGMQGMFVWDENQNGNHIFFPIGSFGYGHRKVVDNTQRWTTESQTNIPYSVLKYTQRSIEMQPATSAILPMYYDLYFRKGAIYWYDNVDSEATDFYGEVSDGYAHDINYHTMLLQTYATNPIGQKDKDGTVSTDGAYIRCVDN